MLSILATNDDGIAAAGLRALVQVLAPAHRLLVVAPASPRSAVGHAVTLDSHVSLRPVELAGAEAYSLDGTPADCVKLALTTICRDCQLVASGINRGPNVGINIFYSGTVGAALEAAIQGRPALAFSVDYPEDGGDIDYSAPAQFAARLVSELERLGLPPIETAGGLPQPLPVLNVNFPAAPPWRGVRLTRQGRSGFREYYREDGTTEWPRHFRVNGDYRLAEEADHFDAFAIKHGFVSITPLGLDLTCAVGNAAATDALRAAAGNALGPQGAPGTR